MAGGYSSSSGFKQGWLAASVSAQAGSASSAGCWQPGLIGQTSARMVLRSASTPEHRQQVEYSYNNAGHRVRNGDLRSNGCQAQLVCKAANSLCCCVLCCFALCCVGCQPAGCHGHALVVFTAI